MIRAGWSSPTLLPPLPKPSVATRLSVRRFADLLGKFSAQNQRRSAALAAEDVVVHGVFVEAGTEPGGAS